MSKENKRKTWKQPWSYREGTMVTAAILLVGFALQAAGGGMVLRVAASVEPSCRTRFSGFTI